MRAAAVFLLAAGTCFGQISWGIRGGVPLTDSYEVAQNYKTIPRHYVIGPTLEVHLPMGFAVTADLLYRRSGYQNGTAPEVTASMFEIPVMVRYRFGAGGVRPFVAAGPTFNRITGLALHDPIEFVKQSAAGIAFSAGIELKGPIRVTPEIRVTQRGSENFKDPTGALLKSRLTQADFLIGLTW